MHSQESQEGDRQRKLERGWGGGFPAGRASGISEWAGRIARLLGSWGVFRMLAASSSGASVPTEEGGYGELGSLLEGSLWIGQPRLAYLPLCLNSKKACGEPQVG